MAIYVENPITGKPTLASDQTTIPVSVDQAGPAAVQSINDSVLAAIDLVPVSSAGNNDGGFNGPLASLDQMNQYAGSFLAYPRDLGSSQKLHSVKFRAYEVNSGNYTLNGVNNYLANTATQVINAVTSEANKTIEEAKKDTFNFLNTLGAEFTKYFNSDGSVLRKQAQPTYKSNVQDTITLYMPDNAEFNYNAQYNKIGLMEAAAAVPFLGKIPNAILSTLKNDAAKVALNRMGYVFNPQEQVLFEGIDFRTFNMSFTLTPYSAAEANEIKNIIRAFRRNAAPTIASGGAGFFFIPPSVFDITFEYNGAPNPNINKVKRSVLTDVTVNYAPNGTWSTHNDGSPVQTNLTLSFKEIELVDRAAVEGGY
jgi:hypothetical protein